MADVLEAEEGVVDPDRHIDSCSFMSSQFDVFTHDYREYTELPPEKEGSGCECGKEGGCGSSSPKNNEKKEVVNTSRKLQKAKFVLQRQPALNSIGYSMPGSEAISGLLLQMDDVYGRLNKFVTAEKGEFTPTTVNLPDFDRDDMEMFLGKEETPNQKTMLEALEEEKGKGKEKLRSTLAEAQFLLLEYDHIKHGI